MNEKQILAARLAAQQITKHDFTNPGDLVRWMGAIQAQDYLGSLWAIGLRLPGKTEAQIEKAIAEKTIVRSWPMRGTLHFVPSEDLRWMLKLLTPRIISKAALLYRQSNLDAAVFRKAEKIILKTLSGKQLTRKEIYDVLEKSKIAVNEQRGLHILGFLAQQGLICFGPRNKKQQTFVLLDEWITTSKNVSREQGLKVLAERFFSSHGPATLNDFVWWTGLTVKDAKVAVEQITFEQFSLNNSQYFYVGKATAKLQMPGIYMLPSYDEYLVGYKDRSLTLDEKSPYPHRGAGGIFTNTIISKGKIAGTWKRKIEGKGIVLENNLFRKLSITEQKDLNKTVSNYQGFLGSFSNPGKR